MILGVDVSTKSIGYAFIQRGRLVGHGKLSFGAGNQQERFIAAANKLQQFKRQHKYTTLVIEEPPYVNNKSVFGSLTMFYGLTLGSLYKPNLNIILPKPLAWQSAIGNSLLTSQEKRGIVSNNPNHTKNWYTEHGRRLRKQRTADWVFDTYNVVVQDNDISDSIGIAYYGHVHGKR